MKKSPFSKIKKTRKKPNELVTVELTERQARAFLAAIDCFTDKSLVGVAAKVAGRLGRIAHLRSVGLMEVLSVESRKKK